MPERWLTCSAEQLAQMKNNFLAFGAGPRACPGQRFALLELRISLVRIFQEFTIHLAPIQVRYLLCLPQESLSKPKGLLLSMTAHRVIQHVLVCSAPVQLSADMSQLLVDATDAC